MQASDGFVEQRQDQTIGELGIALRRGTILDGLAGLVVCIETAVCLRPELTLGDLFPQQGGRLYGQNLAQDLRYVQRHIEPHPIRQLDRTHGHTERFGRGVDRLERDAIQVRIQRFEHIGRQQTVHDKPRRTPTRQWQLADPRNER